MNKKGFSLLEVVLAMLILAVGILAVIGMQISSIRGNFFSNNLTHASVLAQDQLEFLRSRSSDDPELAIGTHNGGQVSGTIFSRQHVVTSPTPDMLSITVTVGWKERTDHSVSFSTVRAR